MRFPPTRCRRSSQATGINAPTAAIFYTYLNSCSGIVILSKALNGAQRITLVLAARVAICQSPSATTGIIPSSIALRSILYYQKWYKHTLLSFAMESKLVPDSDWIPSGPVYNNSMGIYVYCAAHESAHHKRPTQ